MGRGNGTTWRQWPLLAVCTGLLLSGCAALPTSDPTSRQIEMGESEHGAHQNYVLLDLTPEIVAELNQAGGLGRAPGRGVRAPS